MIGPNPQLAANDVDGRLFSLLDRAQIEFEAKKQIYSIATSDRPLSVRISHLQALGSTAPWRQPSARSCWPRPAPCRRPAIQGPEVRPAADRRRAGDARGRAPNTCPSVSTVNTEPLLRRPVRAHCSPADTVERSAPPIGRRPEFRRHHRRIALPVPLFERGGVLVPVRELRVVLLEHQAATGRRRSGRRPGNGCRTPAPTTPSGAGRRRTSGPAKRQLPGPRSPGAVRRPAAPPPSVASKPHSGQAVPSTHVQSLSSASGWGRRNRPSMVTDPDSSRRLRWTLRAGAAGQPLW